MRCGLTAIACWAKKLTTVTVAAAMTAGRSIVPPSWDGQFSLTVPFMDPRVEHANVLRAPLEWPRPGWSGSEAHQRWNPPSDPRSTRLRRIGTMRDSYTKDRPSSAAAVPLLILGHRLRRGVARLQSGSRTCRSGTHSDDKNHWAGSGSSATPFGRGVVAPIGVGEAIRPVVTENPDELIGLLDDPCTEEGEAEAATQGNDAAEPSLEKLVDASSTDAVTS